MFFSAYISILPTTWWVFFLACPDLNGFNPGHVPKGFNFCDSFFESLIPGLCFLCGKGQISALGGQFEVLPQLSTMTGNRSDHTRWPTEYFFIADRLCHIYWPETKIKPVFKSHHMASHWAQLHDLEQMTVGICKNKMHSLIISKKASAPEAALGR